MQPPDASARVAGTCFSLPDAGGDRLDARAARRIHVARWSPSSATTARTSSTSPPTSARRRSAGSTRASASSAINSNDAEQYPDDHPERMVEQAQAWRWSFPYLVDADQTAALAYGAVCTPDFFLFDGAGALVYRGQVRWVDAGQRRPAHRRRARRRRGCAARRRRRSVPISGRASAAASSGSRATSRTEHGTPPAWFWAGFVPLDDLGEIRAGYDTDSAQVGVTAAPRRRAGRRGARRGGGGGPRCPASTRRRAALRGRWRCP